MPLRIVLLKCNSTSPPIPMPSSFFGLVGFCSAKLVRIHTPILMCLYVSASASTGAGGTSGGGALGGAGGVSAGPGATTAAGAGSAAAGGVVAGAATGAGAGAAGAAGAAGGGAACALARPEYSEGSAVTA